MNCPGCALDMVTLTLEGHVATAVTVDLCAACHVFWFDTYESLKLSPASTLKLFTQIGDASTGTKPALPSVLRCPRCRSRLMVTHDRQRDTAFQYWRCNHRHGRLITFFNFLREKSFVKTLSPKQLAELREQVQTVNCSNCGGPVDLAHASACPRCGSSLSMLDMKQAEVLVAQLREASAPRPIDPALPVNLAHVRRQAEAAFDTTDEGLAWRRDAGSPDLVEAGVIAILRWLKDDRA